MLDTQLLSFVKTIKSKIFIMAYEALNDLAWFFLENQGLLCVAYIIF